MIRIFIAIIFALVSTCEPLSAGEEAGLIGNFNPKTDLFLAQFDSKTDVDDLHSVAGVATILRDPRFKDVRYRAVAGAYGIQDGLYVPSPQLFALAFGDNWLNAHRERERALHTLADLVAKTLLSGGSVWVADAGQSDVTADWLRMALDQHPSLDSRNKVHVVQHSDWNESVTSDDKLAYVKEYARYHKIPDGNALDNGSPGFLYAQSDLWPQALQDDNTGPIWKLARDLANQYNGKDGRYLNEAIQANGMDFSDVSETAYIFGFDSLRDAAAFFNEFTNSDQ